MLRIVAIFWAFFGLGSFSAPAKQTHVDKGSEKSIKTLSSVRTFDGVVKKVGFFDKMSLWWQDLKEVRYCLCDKKNKPIAFLKAPREVHKARQLRMLVHRNACIKGVPQYIHKEPYLLILVEDVCP